MRLRLLLVILLLSTAAGAQSGAFNCPCEQYKKRLAKAFGAQEDLIFFVDSSKASLFGEFLRKSGSTYFWGVFLNDSTRMVPVADLEGLPSCSGRIETNVREALTGDSVGYRHTNELSRLLIGGCAPLSAIMNSPGKLTVVLLVHSELSGMFKSEIARIQKEVAQHPDWARIVWIAMDPDCGQ